MEHQFNIAEYTKHWNVWNERNLEMQTSRVLMVTSYNNNTYELKKRETSVIHSLSDEPNTHIPPNRI